MQIEFKTLLKAIAVITLVAILVVMCSTRMTTYNATPDKVADLHAKAQLGDADAQDRLGAIYSFGRPDGGNPDLDRAFFWNSKAAEQGQWKAQYRLAYQYFLGYGTEKNLVLGYKWASLSRLRADKNMLARLDKDLAYTETQLSPEQLQQAKDLIKNWKPTLDYVRADALNASKEADAKARQYDFIQAASLYRKAADFGIPHAQYQLGLMYFNGQGVAQDIKEAAKLINKAADQNHLEAQFWLGDKYLTGEGIGENSKKAALLLEKAAEAGHAEAQYLFGMMHVDELGGIRYQRSGVARSYRLAHKWLSLSAPKNQKAAKALVELEKEMSDELIRDSKKLSDAWKAVRKS